MAVMTPLPDAPVAADAPGAREDAPDVASTLACFRIRRDGGLRLLWTTPVPAGPHAAAVSPDRPS